MKRKCISVILMLAMTVAMFAGCGSNDNTDSSSTTTTDTTDSTVASTTSSTDNQSQETIGPVSENGTTTTSYGTYTEDNPYHLIFSFIEFYEQKDDARQAVQDALNEYMIPNYNIEVEFLPVSYADYQTTIQLMLYGKDDLDVFPIFYSNAASWISTGGVYDLRELLDTPDGQKIIDAVGEENAYVGNMNGIIYGIPANKEAVDLGGLCMRADICDELGLTEKYNLDAEGSDEYKGTSIRWDEAEEIFAAVKEAYPSMTPLYLYTSDQMSRYGFFDTLVDCLGVLDLQADRNSTTVVNMFETDTYKNIVTMLADWYDKGYIYPDAATDTQGTSTMMKAGNTFSYLTSIKPGFLAEAESANGCECYVLYVNTTDDGGIATTNVSWCDTSISTNSKDPEMAFKFVSALYSDPIVMNLWQNGIEGVNYQVLDDGTAYFVDGEDGGNYAYHQNSGWAMGNQYISYVWNDGTKDADYWDKLKQYNEYAYYSPAFGFLWDSTDYATQITALTNAYETYRTALSCGSVGSANVESTVKALNDALYAAGLQDVIDAKQAQLDEFLASKE
jgi:putative aldouronate transport system substrate-binding protein